MSKLYVIAPFFVDEKDAVLMEFLLTLIEKQTGENWKFDQISTADIAIIDVDGVEGKAMYNKMIQQTDGPVPVMLTENVSAEAEFKLFTPIRSADFIAVVKAVLAKHDDLGVKEGIEESQVSETQEFDTERAVKASHLIDELSSPVNITFKRPEIKRLYNYLLENNNVATPAVKITYREFELFVDYATQQFYCDHKVMLLSTLCKADINNVVIQSLPVKGLQKVKNNIIGRPLCELIWNSVLLGGSGELIEKFNAESLFHLKRWPNPKLMKEFPKFIRQKYMALTAFMVKGSSTIADISRQTNVQLDTVVDFVNACFSVGYLDMQPEKAQIVKKSVPARKERNSLFGKIRSKFGLREEVR